MRHGVIPLMGEAVVGVLFLGSIAVIAAILLFRAAVNGPVCAAYVESPSGVGGRCMEWLPSARKPPPKRGHAHTLTILQ